MTTREGMERAAEIPEDTLDRLFRGQATQGDQMLAYNVISDLRAEAERLPAGSAPERKEAATDKAIVDAIASKPLDAWTPSDKLALLAFATRSTAPERREVARRLLEAIAGNNRYNMIGSIQHLIREAAALLDPEGR